MRYLHIALAAVTFALVVVFGAPAGVSYAAFHCMRIHAVKAGFAGDGTIQYVELRMDAAGQPFVSGHTLEFRDGTGTLKATFTFPANAVNSAQGESILVATSEFNANVSGGLADFTFAGNTVGANGGDPLHPVQAPNGKVIFAAGSANCNSTAPVDSVAAGAVPADYGTAAVALPPASDNRALRLSNLSTAPSNNSTEYSLNAVSSTTFSVPQANLPTDFATPRNNGRVVLRLNAPLGPPPSVGGVAAQPDVSGAVPAAVATDGGGTSWLWYEVLGGVVGIAALGALWVMWRRTSARL